MIKDKLKFELSEQIKSLKRQRASANELEKRRIDAMITFRKSPDALCGYQGLMSFHRFDFIDRACSYQKKVAMQYEEIPLDRLEGGTLEKISAKYKIVTLLYLFFNKTAKLAKKSMVNEGNHGVLGGYITDEFYQSSKLFPEFLCEKNLSIFEKLKRKSVGAIEMRNRYRRVVNLSLSENRIAYFKYLQRSGVAGIPQRPIIIASIGGGTGSVEMDVQQHLREKYGIYSRIIIFDVVDQNRINGSFFAKMRGADICWIIQTPGDDDLLTQQAEGRLDSFLSTPAQAMDSHGDAVVVAENMCRSFHQVIMSGLWAKFEDKKVLDFLTIIKRMMHPGAEAVVTLSKNKYIDMQCREKVIPAMQILDHLGHGKDGVWYRSIEQLKEGGLLENAGFKIISELDGPVLPVIAIAPFTRSSSF